VQLQAGCRNLRNVSDIDSTRDLETFEDDPDLSPLDLARRRYKRWKIELDAARKELDRYRQDGREASSRFRDERAQVDSEYSINDRQLRRLNIYTSDVQVKRDELFGNVPKVDVSRRYGDAKDQAARLAGVIQQRLLNSDIEHDERVYCITMERALLDALVPGFGLAMARYVPPGDDGCPEDVETFYLHWGDVLWSPCRVWEENRWVAHGCEMSKEDVTENFALSVGEVLLSQEQEPPPEEPEAPESRPPPDVSMLPPDQAAAALQEHAANEAQVQAEHQEALEAQQAAVSEWEEAATARGKDALRKIPMDAQRGMTKRASGNDSEDKSKQNYPWDRAYVWEIWDKERRQLVHVLEGFDLVLKCVDDPLKLKSFYPFPEPMMANLTNDKCVPVSDWKLARGLYEEVDVLTARIAALIRACKIAGGYDKTVPEIGRIFDEAEENRLVPVENWLMFNKEKGGIKGCIELIPMDQVTQTIDTLVQQRLNALDLLRQITGMADLMRGQQAENGTPGEAAIKYQAASVRMRAWQKRFARFASELQSIKAEIISKCFSDETILQRANVEMMEDAAAPGGPQLVQRALEIIRGKFHEYRIVVRPESIAAEDFATLRAERTEFLAAMSDLLTKAQAAGSAMPAVVPGLLEIAKWSAAGLKGGKEIEGTFDRMIDAAAQQAAKAQAQPQQPNPDVVKAQAQAQVKAQELQLKASLDERRMQQETQQDALRDQAEARQKASEAATEHQQEMEADRVRAQLDIEKARAIQALKPVPTIQRTLPNPRPKKV
jgi:hypothetical protein